MPSTVSLASYTGGQTEVYAASRIPFAVKSGQTVRGGRMLELTGDMEVQEAGAASTKVVGYAMHDADPAGEIKKVTTWGRGPILEGVASGAVAFGDLLVTGAGGTLVSAGAAAAGDARQMVGRAVKSAADTAKVWYMHFGGTD